MKRFLYLYCALLLLLLCACEAVPAPAEGSAPVPEPSAVSTAPEATAPPAPSAAPVPETPAPTPEAMDWQGIYSAFLEDNYTAINEIYFGPPLGLGFIDLDIDGVPEMVLFDGGASAALGVELFDIIDGQVECVSAALQNELFRGAYFQDVTVNANYFEDFRLMYDRECGLYHFWVDSGNGALDFSFQEKIIFRNAGRNEHPGRDGLLELYSTLYKFENYDMETGEVTEARYQVNGQAADAEAYTDLARLLDANLEDMSYEAKGIFIWGNDSYTEDADGFSRLIADAVDAYVPLPDDVYQVYADWNNSD